MLHGNNGTAKEGEGVLVIEDLTKSYGSRTVVNGLNLRLAPGEIYGFLGPNGAGKSTTISMILGLTPPSAGRISLFGCTLRQDYFGIKRRIGVVAEYQHFYGEMSGLEYLAFFAGLYGVEDGRSKARALLTRVGLEQYAGLRLGSYSKGMQQKIALARALIHNPELLILDEPVSSLDPQGVKLVRDIIMEENKRGKTIFISSHLLSEIEKTCSRIGIMNHGVLLAEDDMDGVRERLAGGVEIEIEIEGHVEQAMAALEAAHYVEAVSINGRTITVRTAGGGDHRGDISRLLAACGGVVLGMRKRRMTLEEAFITITENNLHLLSGKAVGV